MAYSDFTATDLTKKFGLRFGASNFFEQVKPVVPSNWLKETLVLSKNLGYSSEKSRSERFVSPILTELCARNNFRFLVYSGLNMDVDAEAGLRGECDFILSGSEVQDFVTSPIVCITEAKKQDIEQGTIQVTAQLLGARKLNELEGNILDTLYGCSTTGTEWRFLKLEQNVVTLEKERISIDNIAKILGILQYIVDTTLTLHSD